MFTREWKIIHPFMENNAWWFLKYGDKINSSKTFVFGKQ
jgi:hypothetical protein